MYSIYTYTHTHTYSLSLRSKRGRDEKCTKYFGSKTWEETRKIWAYM